MGGYFMDYLTMVCIEYPCIPTVILQHPPPGGHKEMSSILADQ
jgi:hypothetical protein